MFGGNGLGKVFVLNLFQVVTVKMTDPLILKAEKFGCNGRRNVKECFCFRCGKKVNFEENEFVFDCFGRIFCCDGCREPKNMEEL